MKIETKVRVRCSSKNMVEHCWAAVDMYREDGEDLTDRLRSYGWFVVDGEAYCSAACRKASRRTRGK